MNASDTSLLTVRPNVTTEWRLADLFAGIAEVPQGAVRDQLVTGLFDDSRRVTEGGAFVAVRGTTVDGRRFVQQAADNGARVIVGEELPTVPGALTLHVDDARAALARLAARWYGLDRPDLALRLVGVTGTNGKSTTAHMIRAIARAAGMRCGMLGTVQYDLGMRSLASEMTTPGPLDLARYLYECSQSDIEMVVMEVSSHALDQRRTDGLRFDVGVFTNLTQDHLDYHGTMERYGDAKARLFEGLAPESHAVINVDDPQHERLARDCPAAIVRYGIDRPADLRALITRETIEGTVYRVRSDAADIVLENALVGRHNVYNALAAIGVARALEFPSEAVRRGLTNVRTIPGRLQRVPSMRGVDVFVDYAHTEDALRNVAGVLRPLTRNRLTIVFGCGGDRDRGKRPAMARAAAEFADALIVTSDNPRREEPMKIIEDILAGLEPADRRRAVVEPDRRQAIHAALAATRPGDVVLIAGKGHEDYQIVGDQRLHFDDVETALQAAARLAGSAERLEA